MQSSITVLLWASIAALASLPGGLVRWTPIDRPTPWIGWSHALAAGGMLGAAFVLTSVPRIEPIPAAVGGILGVAFISLSHTLTGAGRVDLSRPNDGDPSYGYRLVVIQMLHGCTEGLAIGVAMAVDLSLGIFVALAIAVHNIPEAAVLAAATRDLRLGRGGSLGLAFLSNLGQPLLALAAWVVIEAAPATLPWTLGFAVGALLNLLLTELLPSSYRESGATSIALVASIALGLVVLLGGGIP